MVESSPVSPVESGGEGPQQVLRRLLQALHLLGLAIFVHRTLRNVRYGLVNVLGTMSRWPLLGRTSEALVLKLDGRALTRFEEAEFLRVIEALKASGLTFWVAGGWGLDVLVGCETRRHGDIDIVIDSYAENLATFDTVVRALGYRHTLTRGGTTWFPDASVYEDRRGFQLEALGINWELLRAARALVGDTTAVSTDPDLDLRSLVDRCTSEGRIGGTVIPALSLEAQRLFHSGYEKRREDVGVDELFHLISTADEWSRPDRADLGATSRTGRHAPTTLLLIPVFDIPNELWRLCKLYHNDLDHIPPHITVAYPFLPLADITTEVVDQLGSLFAKIPTVDFSMEKMSWFGDGVVYLEPTPSDTFISTVEELQCNFPDFVPYEGAFESIIPHLTLSEHGSEGDRSQLAQRAQRFLPLSATASHVWLMSNHVREGDWSLIKVFELGSHV